MHEDVVGALKHAVAEKDDVGIGERRVVALSGAGCIVHIRRKKQTVSLWLESEGVGWWLVSSN